MTPYLAQLMTEDSRHTLVVESVEEGIAAVEVDGKSVSRIPVSLLPLRVREGAVLRLLVAREGQRSILTIEPDPELEKKLLARSRAQAESKHGKDKGGNISLQRLLNFVAKGINCRVLFRNAAKGLQGVYR